MIRVAICDDESCFVDKALEMLAAYEEAREESFYLERQTERIETMTTGRLCENETVNNILKVYQQKAAAQNIAMEIRAAAKPTISIPAPELVTVIANILENALHGAAEAGGDGAFIRFSIKHKSQRLVVRCENTCHTYLNFEDMPEHLRGIGIHSIGSAADRFGGSCHFSAAEGVFSAMVIMNE